MTDADTSAIEPLDARLRRQYVPDDLDAAGVALLQANNELTVRDLGDQLGSFERHSAESSISLSFA